MDVVATVFELKPRTTESVEAWAAYIRDHRSGAEASLRAEGVTVESWFSLSLAGKDYLLCYLRTESLAESHRVVAQSAREIDAVHQRFKAGAFVPGSRVEARLLVDLGGGQS